MSKPMPASPRVAISSRVIGRSCSTRATRLRSRGPDQQRRQAGQDDEDDPGHRVHERQEHVADARRQVAQAVDHLGYRSRGVAQVGEEQADRGEDGRRHHENLRRIGRAVAGADQPPGQPVALIGAGRGRRPTSGSVASKTRSRIRRWVARCRPSHRDAAASRPKPINAAMTTVASPLRGCEEVVGADLQVCPGPGQTWRSAPTKSIHHSPLTTQYFRRLRADDQTMPTAWSSSTPPTSIVRPSWPGTAACGPDRSAT